MEKNNSFRKAFYHLKFTQEYFLDYIREYPKSIGAGLCKTYLNRIDFIFRDVMAQPILSKEDVAEFKGTLQEDPFVTSEIARLAQQLSPKQKITLETILNSLIAGEEINVILNEGVEQ